MTVTGPGKARHNSVGVVVSVKMLLALALAGWLALFPLVQIHHLAGAGHSHHFCPEHNQLEGNLDGHEHEHAHPSHLDTRSAHHAELEGTDITASNPLHVACALCESISKRAQFELPGSTLQVEKGLEERTTNCRLEDATVAALLLLFAPKHSPPA
jgi:hypothetical protein